MDFGDLQMDWSTPNSLNSGICYTPFAHLHPYQTPPSAAPALCALSPILFEDSTIDQLWGNAPVAAKVPSQSAKENTSIKNKHGLKYLSLKIRDIVEALGSGTYKEVADNQVVRRYQRRRGNSAGKETIFRE